MMTVDEIRRSKLRELEREAGSLKALADKLERSESQVSQWKNAAANSGTGKPRGMSSASARYIERTMGKPEGWMDQPSLPAASSAHVVSEPLPAYGPPSLASAHVVSEPLPAYGPPSLASALPVVLSALASLAPDVRDSVIAAMRVYNPDSHNASRAQAYMLGELSGTPNNRCAA